jgi:hypothetical protein
MLAPRHLSSLLRVVATVLLACTSDDDDNAGQDGGNSPMDAQVDASSATWCEDCLLSVQLQRRAAPGATDCGSIRSPGFGEDDAGPSTAEEAVLDCVRAALEQREPFVVVLEQQGIDSIVQTGWVGSGDGTVEALSFDSDICGGAGCSQSCGPRIYRFTCPEPAVADDPYAVIECAAGGESEEVCGPPE